MHVQATVSIDHYPEGIEEAVITLWDGFEVSLSRVRFV